jgi:hypothetical protein
MLVTSVRGDNENSVSSEVGQIAFKESVRCGIEALVVRQPYLILFAPPKYWVISSGHDVADGLERLNMVTDDL